MQEFIANKNNDKRLYRSTRKKYKRWIWGNLAMLICFVIVCLAYKWVFKGADEVSVGAFIVGTGVALIPFAIGLMCRAIAVSGGREVLMNRLSDKVYLFDNFLSMEYVPHARETVAFDYMKYQIMYRDIRSLVYDEKRGRLEISGKYQIVRYKQAALGKVTGNVIIEEIPDGTFYLYAHYDNFETCMDQIYKMSGLRK